MHKELRTKCACKRFLGFDCYQHSNFFASLRRQEQELLDKFFPERMVRHRVPVEAVEVSRPALSAAFVLVGAALCCVQVHLVLLGSDPEFPVLPPGGDHQAKAGQGPQEDLGA